MFFRTVVVAVADRRCVGTARVEMVWRDSAGRDGVAVAARRKVEVWREFECGAGRTVCE